MKDENYPPLTPPKEGDSFPLGRLGWELALSVGKVPLRGIRGLLLTIIILIMKSFPIEYEISGSFIQSF